MSEAAPRGTVEVRKATAADVPGMARALGRAFYDDPVMAWMMPEERRRRRLESLGFVQWLKRIYMPKGEVYTDGALAGGALWAPPGKWRMPVREGWQRPDMTPGVMLAFTDSRNGHWLRLTDGRLIEKDQDVVARRRIRFPQRISVPESY